MIDVAGQAYDPKRTDSKSQSRTPTRNGRRTHQPSIIVDSTFPKTVKHQTAKRTIFDYTKLRTASVQERKIFHKRGNFVIQDTYTKPQSQLASRGSKSRASGYDPDLTIRKERGKSEIFEYLNKTVINKSKTKTRK